VPDSIKLNRFTIAGPWNDSDRTSKKIPSDTQKEASTAMLPIQPPAFFGIFFQNIPLIRNPISGKSGTK
jgi:hypothetical protein